MSVNTKIQSFITRLGAWRERAKQQAEEAYSLKEEFAELYQSGQELALDEASGDVFDYLEGRGVVYADIVAGVNQGIVFYWTFWEGGSSISARQRGEDIRRLP